MTRGVVIALVILLGVAARASVEADRSSTQVDPTATATATVEPPTSTPVPPSETPEPAPTETATPDWRANQLAHDVAAKETEIASGVQPRLSCADPRRVPACTGDN